MSEKIAHTTWHSYTEYVLSLNISEKLEKKETDPGYLSSHAFYLQIFQWFAPAFTSINNETLQRLSLAGYTYFRSALLFDVLMDSQLNDDKQHIEHLLLGLSYHEHAVRELATLFPTNDHFWTTFNDIKKHYTQANLLEKQISKDKIEYDRELFEQIAKGKSYLSVASVLSLCSVEQDFTHYESLKNSLLSFHIGYQLFDDIDDFGKDISENQRTYAICRVEKFIKNHIRTDGQITNHEKKKYLYISGIANDLLWEAKTYFKNSLKNIEALPVDGYKRLIQAEIDKCEKLHWEIDQSLEKTKIKTQRSHSYRDQSHTPILHDEVILSLKSSLSFLESTLEEDFVWSDFLTNAGVSKGWVTGFIGYHLSEAGVKSDFLKKVADHIKDRLDSSGTFNDSMIRDGDSLTFTIGFLHHYYPAIAANLANSWITYQQIEGGWVTYKDSDKLRQKLNLPLSENVSGWTSPSPCVSVTAALVMNKLPNLNENRQITLKYLTGCQSKDGYIPSYWWTSPVYATSFAAIAFGQNPEWKDCKEKCIHWLLKRQLPNGAWDAGYETGGESAFYTALALKALLQNISDRNPSQYLDDIKKGFRWLVDNQMSDGSWKTKRILRIPATDVTNPQMVKYWRRSSFGVNTIIDDHYRNFTTAIVFSAMSDFLTLNNQG